MNIKAKAAAVATGTAIAFVCERVVGALAAERAPSWYIALARVHKHLAVELWTMRPLLLTALIAIACGGLFAMLSRRDSKRLVLLAAGAWVLYELGVDAGGDAQVCLHPVQCFMDTFRLDPIAGTLHVLVPAGAVLGYSWVRAGRA